MLNDDDAAADHDDADAADDDEDAHDDAAMSSGGSASGYACIALVLYPYPYPCPYCTVLYCTVLYCTVHTYAKRPTPSSPQTEPLNTDSSMWVSSYKDAAGH